MFCNWMGCFDAQQRLTVSHHIFVNHSVFSNPNQFENWKDSDALIEHNHDVVNPYYIWTFHIEICLKTAFSVGLCHFYGVWIEVFKVLKDSFPVNRSYTNFDLLHVVLWCNLGYHFFHNRLSATILVNYVLGCTTATSTAAATTGPPIFLSIIKFYKLSKQTVP